MSLALPAPAGAADSGTGVLAALFAEEPGWMLEVRNEEVDGVLQAFRSVGVAATVVGKTRADSKEVRVEVRECAHTL